MLATVIAEISPYRDRNTRTLTPARQSRAIVGEVPNFVSETAIAHSECPALATHAGQSSHDFSVVNVRKTSGTTDSYTIILIYLGAIPKGPQLSFLHY